MTLDHNHHIGHVMEDIPRDFTDPAGNRRIAALENQVATLKCALKPFVSQFKLEYDTDSAHARSNVLRALSTNCMATIVLPLPDFRSAVKAFEP